MSNWGPEDAERHERLRNEVMKELVETEVSYVEHVKTIVQVQKLLVDHNTHSSPPPPGVCKPYKSARSPQWGRSINNLFKHHTYSDH